MVEPIPFSDGLANFSEILDPRLILNKRCVFTGGIEPFYTLSNVFQKLSTLIWLTIVDKAAIVIQVVAHLVGVGLKVIAASLPA